MGFDTIEIILRFIILLTVTDECSCGVPNLMANEYPWQVCLVQGWLTIE